VPRSSEARYVIKENPQPATERIATLDDQSYLRLQLDQPPGTQVLVIIETADTPNQPEAENVMLAGVQS